MLNQYSEDLSLFSVISMSVDDTVLSLTSNLKTSESANNSFIETLTSQLICCANQLTGFYMSATLAFNGLKQTCTKFFNKFFKN